MSRRIPPSQLDAEEVAQKLFYYMRIQQVDTMWLALDPAGRDASRVVAKLYANPDVNSREDYDRSLAQADASIAALTPPKSPEDRVLRLHVASGALMVYYELKLIHESAGQAKLKSQIIARKSAL
ncbi:hypothetical protein C8Q72DRAFT_816575 [Fomitopsis betulina]|nr:hypothetical protein C8Q72DRAFT_816575 [Fomitopsis betulina]